MVDAVNAVPGQTVTLDPSLLQGGGGATDPTKALDKEAFLKLLVAQLKYQDPMNPSSNEEFIATTAQFTTIEKLDQLATQSALTSQINSLATASALIGRQVSVVGADGELQTATVLRGEFAGGVLTLQTDLGPLSLDQVVALAGAATPSPATSLAPASPPSPATTTPPSTEQTATAPAPTTDPTTEDTPS